MTKLRVIFLVFVVIVLAIVGWFWRQSSLNAEAPLTPVTYTSEQQAVVTAIAQGVVADPAVSGLLAKQSCPTTIGGYDINPEVLAKGLMDLLGGNPNDGCYHITVDGKITPKVYWMSLTRAVLVVSGEVKITIEYYDENCELQTITIDKFTFRLAFSIKNNGQVGGIVPLPTGKPICVIRLASKPIHYEVGKLDKAKCPVCLAKAQQSLTN